MAEAKKNLMTYEGLQKFEAEPKERAGHHIRACGICSDELWRSASFMEMKSSVTIINSRFI